MAHQRLPAAADQAVATIATQLGDPTGRCPVCGRLWRLVGGLVPHHAAKGGPHGRVTWCAGSEHNATPEEASTDG